MTLFIIIALLITVSALALLLWPLRKNRHSISYARQAQNIHFAKERIQELEDQLKNANISATDYEALKLEIESTLADDIDIATHNNNEQPISTPNSNTQLVVALLVLVPLFAGGVYYFTGTPESFNLVKQANEQPSSADVATLLKSVEQRLKDNPNDIKGWTLLSRSYLELGRYQEAKQGFKNLLQLQGESAELLTTLADASGLAANGIMAGEPMSYVNRALELNPQYPQALWMAGLGAAQIGDTSTAITRWTQLEPLLADSPLQQEELRALITETKKRSQALNAEPTSAVVQQETEASNNGIQVNVFLDPVLTAQTSPTDTVFVFAKATQGPPAPLAVKRLTVAELPASITLNDDDAMLAQFKLSLFENVSISARVAKAGNPIAQPGDFESEAVDVKNNTKKKVNVIISSVVK